MITIILRREGQDYERLSHRLSAEELTAVRLTIISFEEQARGWLARIAKARKAEEQVRFYKMLHRLLDFYRQFEILDFDDKSAECYKELQQSRVRIGTMDLRIAAIVLSHDAALISRNLRDFQKVPGLSVEDWTNPA
ncbi:MAG: type II toxin-antitoxin system VapC family toxin [Gemmataceae bacterium]|nr:type II toxin-antitoxin system VapC family toxin [Gemmataceae bacterium]